MSELEAFTQLLMIIGLVMSMPFFYKACYMLGKFITLKFFPPKHITIEVFKRNGDVEISKVAIDDNSELVKALLKSSGRSIS